MPVLNTPRLTVEVIDGMNAGIRPFVVPIGERDNLAKYYGVGVRTVERWFAPEGGQYRRCVPLRDNPISGRLGAENRRIFQMFDDSNKGGQGDGSNPEQPLQNMRLRVFLAASLGVEGGLSREPIYHGPQRVVIQNHASLSACVGRINKIYTGAAEFFLWKAWTNFEIFPINDDPDKTWQLVVTYNVMLDGDASDAEEIETPEDSEGEGEPEIG